MPSYLYSNTALANSPSVRQGIPRDVETSNRVFICHLVEQAGNMLKLPITTIVTAQIIIHRFYYRKSMKEHKVLPVAMTALFLACKVEESPRKIRDVLNVFDRLLKKRQKMALVPFDSRSERWERWRTKIKGTELVILCELGYVLYVDHPHKFMLHYIRSMEDSKKVDLWKEVAQRSWNFLNDSFRTNLCLRFRPEVLATAAIYLSLRILQVPIPDDPPWYSVFDCALVDLQEAASVMADLYTHHPIEYKAISEQDQTNEIFILDPKQRARTQMRLDSKIANGKSKAASDSKNGTGDGKVHKSSKSDSKSKDSTSSSSSLKKSKSRKDDRKLKVDKGDKDKRDKGRTRHRDRSKRDRRRSPDARRKRRHRESRRRRSSSRSRSRSRSRSPSRSPSVSSPSRSRSRSRSPAKRDRWRRSRSRDRFGRSKASRKKKK